MNEKLLRGAKIVTENWLQVKEDETLLIVTNHEHENEANLIRQCAVEKNAKVDILTFPTQNGQVGHYFDTHEDAFDAYDVILGATTHSLVTTKAVKRAVEYGKRFLSLPLSTNNGESMLTFDFLLMDTTKAAHMANQLITFLNKATYVKIRTEIGTELMFRKKGRDAKYFHGSTTECNGYASSSFEVYIPIEEDQTEGVAYVDASLGYHGLVDEPVQIALNHGKIVKIEESSDGDVFRAYLEQFEDEGMYVAGELGIGLNTFANCDGNCYIEDESAYGTFHIGFGRNIALGGVHQAKAHFDLVFHAPDIYADDILIMRKGKIVYADADTISI